MTTVLALAIIISSYFSSLRSAAWWKEVLKQIVLSLSLSLSLFPSLPLSYVGDMEMS